MTVLISLVFSLYDSTEDAIKKMIAANEKTLNLDDDAGLAATTRRLHKLQISTLRGTPRDARQLEWIILRRERAKRSKLHLGNLKTYRRN